MTFHNLLCQIQTMNLFLKAKKQLLCDSSAVYEWCTIAFSSETFEVVTISMVVISQSFSLLSLFLLSFFPLVIDMLNMPNDC